MMPSRVLQAPAWLAYPFFYTLDYLTYLFLTDVELECNYLRLYARIIQVNYGLLLALNHVRRRFVHKH